MSKFKVGDKVVRIGYNNGPVKVGAVYIVVGVAQGSLLLEGVEKSIHYSDEYFELVQATQVSSYPSKLIEEFITKTNGIVSFAKDTIIIIQNEDFIEYKCATMERAEEVMKALLVLREGE